MKKIILFILIAVFTASALCAQPKNLPDTRLGEMERYVQAESGTEYKILHYEVGNFTGSGDTEVLVLFDEKRGNPEIAATVRLAEGHFGLRGMRNRVAVLDGEFRITTSPGGGTQVFAEIPLHLNGGGVDGTPV